MLEIEWMTDEPAASAGMLVVLPLSDGYDADALGARFGSGVADAAAQAHFKGKPGESFGFTRDQGGVFTHVTLLGASGLDKAVGLRQLAHDAAREAQRVGAKHLVLDLANESLVDDATQAGNLIAQGLQLGIYSYDRFLSEANRRPVSLTKVSVRAASTAPSEGTDRGQIVARCITRARDLGNGPSDLVTPTYLANTAKDLVDELKNAGFDVELTVLERADCVKRNMGCYLGVARGSEQPPKFIHMRYRPTGSTTKGRVCLIGKGVTFDSGGYSLKPTDGMLDMKLDMCGAAAVIGAFEGFARLKVPYEVNVIVAATENMVSGGAYKLGDVLTASNGKTVEINNTDAEGRLTMADALVYGASLEPDVMINFATLTGACIIALGPRIAGVMTKDEKLYADWQQAAERSGESMWRLPLPEDLKEQLKSKIADMKNTGERWGGALTAGLFLSEFNEGKRWMHVDIAGPAMASKAYGVTTPGGSGFAVATILELVSGELTGVG